MNLHHLRVFHQVARERSFTGASLKLNVTQPSVTQTVQELEAALGQPLFLRSRKGISLTSAGEIAFEKAQQIFALTDELEDELREALPESRPLEGEWVLGASDNLAIHVIPPLVARFKEEHPGLRVQLMAGTSKEIKSDLQSGRCDLGIFYTPLKDYEPFRQWKIGEAEFVIVIARENRWFGPREAITVAELRKRKIPRIESRHADYARGFPAHFESRKLGMSDEQPWIEANQHEVKKALVLAGAGFAFLTRHAVERELADKTLRLVAAPKPMIVPLYGVRSRSRPLGRASRLFLDLWHARNG